jgi:pyruvate dehydrogenase E1 component alpha subunit
MPCHPGSRDARYVTMSSCIATQLPHAVGMAMAAKLRHDPVVIAGYMGDGATSEGDFHVALNFAAVYRAPVVLVCQNNQWAISTPVAGQTASPTIAHKALGYGIPALRVDGNDVLACYAAMRDAAAFARAGGGPMFLEALTYRVSAHSTSDDPSRYRDESVTAVWKSERDPLWCAFATSCASSAPCPTVLTAHFTKRSKPRSSPPSSPKKPLVPPHSRP